MTDRPEPLDAIGQAAAFIRDHRDTYTPGALVAELREAGYPEDVIDAAFRAELDSEPPPRPTTDLRATAAKILLVAFLGTWAVLSAALVLTPSFQRYGYSQIAFAVVSILLGIVLAISLAVVAESGRLRRGAEGALVTVLAIPFILLFGVAGLCVMTMGSMR